MQLQQSHTSPSQDAHLWSLFLSLPRDFVWTLSLFFEAGNIDKKCLKREAPPLDSALWKHSWPWKTIGGCLSVSCLHLLSLLLSSLIKAARGHNERDGRLRLPLHGPRVAALPMASLKSWQATIDLCSSGALFIHSVAQLWTESCAWHVKAFVF